MLAKYYETLGNTNKYQCNFHIGYCYLNNRPHALYLTISKGSSIEATASKTHPQRELSNVEQ